ncbi:class I SAM-dependent methyltransferase [Pseudobacteroides cellulosolvens]|uniref:Methyltransferase type 11 n=1 Tax=Pseudobacteroides cellulosolvens ATCC 35603 = DSM 2933 TaxID=398512 RepID=A0A0L6JW38_9FIRM|nr:class I SAM-dependent methyltransferase [Pseudobacteroides cellulosolvens]KNY29647.1 hypothetical protein Bccel_4921 [Pseudobacteroides cellulosolvens ATCC 35603 = DSM 2933]
MANLYDSKDKSYYAHVRNDIICMIPGTGHKILEIGCGCGATLIELKKTGIASEVVGIEINPHTIRHNEALLDKTIVGNIETMELEFPENYFDIIIMADVLEHLVNPWEVLKKVKRYLSKSGYIVTSVPNIREFSTMKTIFLKGDFRYEEAGIMDKTHLRFFCKKNIMELLSKDYDIERVETFPELKIGKKALLNRLTFRKLEEFLVIQYICLAKYKKEN